MKMLFLKDFFKQKNRIAALIFYGEKNIAQSF